MTFSNQFTQMTGARVPLICGAMYPCSNPELVAAASAAGAMGIIQPLSFSYVYKRDLRDAIRFIKSVTSNPIGFNAVIEKGSKKYHQRMQAWVEIALEEGIKFFVTALGNPAWVVQRVHAAGGLVFHNVTEKKWAMKAKDSGVDGLICINNRAGGHAGGLSAQELFGELKPLGLPLVCGGGVADAKGFVQALGLGYIAVQAGTRFIATHECAAHQSYKAAIVAAQEKDIVITERVTAVPLSVIRTKHVDQVGTEIGWLGKFFLKQPQFRHLTRLLYALIAAQGLKKSALSAGTSADYWQAGKGVGAINSIVSVMEVVKSWETGLDAGRAH